MGEKKNCGTRAAIRQREADSSRGHRTGENLQTPTRQVSNQRSRRQTTGREERARSKPKAEVCWSEEKKSASGEAGRGRREKCDGDQTYHNTRERRRRRRRKKRRADGRAAGGPWQIREAAGARRGLQLVLKRQQGRRYLAGQAERRPRQVQSQRSASLGR